MGNIFNDDFRDFIQALNDADDVMINVKGMDFDECYPKSIVFEDDGLNVRTIHITDLLSAKQASGRPKDIDDLENLSM